jgi:TctA family transporter
MIKERAQAAIEPSPFFQTRVMAAWREQQAVESVPAIMRLWRSSRALVSSMALATVGTDLQSGQSRFTLGIAEKRRIFKGRAEGAGLR